MSKSPTNFPREDLGETQEFKITSGSVKIDICERGLGKATAQED